MIIRHAGGNLRDRRGEAMDKLFKLLDEWHKRVEKCDKRCELCRLNIIVVDDRDICDTLNLIYKKIRETS